MRHFSSLSNNANLFYHPAINLAWSQLIFFLRHRMVNLLPVLYYDGYS